jgi:hypothetical protein
MSDPGQELSRPASITLREIAVAERLEFYREASTTGHADIREHILREMELDAVHRRSQEALASAHRRKQEARLSPSVALAVCILAFIAAAGTVIYLHTSLKVPLLGGLTGICIFVALVISATALLLSNVLKPAEFLEMLRHAKGYIFLGKTSDEADNNE